MQKGKEGKRAGLDEVERKAELGHLRRLSLICAARVKRALVLLELRQLQLKAVLPPSLSLSLLASSGLSLPLLSLSLPSLSLITQQAAIGFCAGAASC